MCQESMLKSSAPLWYIILLHLLSRSSQTGIQVVSVKGIWGKFSSFLSGSSQVQNRDRVEPVTWGTMDYHPPTQVPWRRERSALQDSGLENSVDCTVRGVAKSRTRLNHFHFHPIVTPTQPGNSQRPSGGLDFHGA